MYILGIDPTKIVDNSASEIPGFEVGQLGVDDEGKVYQFVRANGAIDVVGDVVGIDEAGDATPVTTTTSAPAAGQGLPVGVAVVALEDNDWGWVQRYGVVAAINVASSCAVHTELNSTASGGRVDDDATTGAEVIEGLTTTAAESSNSAAGILNWPYIGRTL
jgi:hypothetical protein